MGKIKKGLLLSAAAAGLTAFLIAPEKPDFKKKAPFLGRAIAHRGLHTKDKSIPENSLSAFRRAAAFGYGAELDVHLTADQQVVVFHDDTLNRVCGVEGVIEDLTYEELLQYRLCQTDEKIPLLTEALVALRGNPVIVELKRGRNNDLLAEKTLEILRRYRGAFCIESFDPTIVSWFRKNAPDVYRGQLACRNYGSAVSAVKAFALRNGLSNVIARPNFIAYEKGKRPLFIRLAEKMGASKVSWTIRGYGAEGENDTIIFEYYYPKARYR